MGKVFGWIIVFIIAISCVTMCTGVCNSTTSTVVKEFAPGALLKKYEYFKDLSAGVDKADANIKMYQEEIADLEKKNDGSRDDKFYIQQRKSELMGLISVRNSVAADYNAQMSKFNWRFTNAGDLPAGATVPLPRDYKPYQTSTK